MKRTLTFLVMAAACAVASAADDFFGGGDEAGKIIINAADAKRVVPPMRFGADAKAAKGKFLEIPDSPKGGPKIHGGQAEFVAQVKEDGKYVLFLRVWWPDACGNSFNVVVGKKAPKCVTDSTVRHWHWVKLPHQIFKLKKGAVKIVVRNREDGARFDQILLTTDREYVPVGIEE